MTAGDDSELKEPSDLNELARALESSARDVVRVIQLSERSGSDALQWMTLLRAAQEMREVPLDPGPLFDAILATTSPELLWTDGPMLERLMDTVDAPDDVRSWVRKSVPAMGETQPIETREESANEAITQSAR